MKAKVSVVIPNYNGIDYLENCLNSLMLQSVKSFEIIIVDDCSTDNSIEKVMEKYPDNGAYPKTRYIIHKENKGFCTSVNDGIKASQAEYVILLNNDTIAKPEFVREMYRAISRNENIFSVGARMVSMQNNEIMDDGGDYYCLLGWAFSPAKDKPVNNFNKRKRIFSACGGAVIYRKDILDKIGLFDENHFAYLEDVDIGYRAKLSGFVNIYEPNATVIHAGSASSGSRYNEFKAKLTARNNLYLIYKNMPNWQLIINMPWLILGTVVKLGFCISKGLGKAYFTGLIEGFKLIRSNEGKAARVDFTKIGIFNQIKLEFELIGNTFVRFM